MRKLAITATILSMASGAGAGGHRPETWFHLIGGNVSKAGVTADLEAIKAAGIGGIQFFHGQFGGPWPGVPEQIPCLSEKWDDVVRHIGLECRRLGLTLRLQNCPGWSMSGGPWIDDAHAMRKLVLDGEGRDYHAVGDATVADVPEPMRALRPVAVATNGDARVYSFASAVTLRSVALPCAQAYNHDFAYEPGLRMALEARRGEGWATVFDRDYPQSNYADVFPETFSFPATEAREWRLTVRHAHPIALRRPGLLREPVFSAAARIDNWEAKAGWTLRDVSASGGAGEVPPRAAPRVLRFGHVNAGKFNYPAPPEATGWECDKLDPRGVEASFAGYVARLLDGPLRGVPVQGVLIDSWECGAQSWTWRMPEYFKAINGYDLAPWLPALFGHVVRSPAETESFLRDWRRTQGELVKEHYYRRFAELAHARGLDVQYETAMGDVIAGDILSYWKYADTPMCEFWSPHDDANGFVTSYDFKPVRPCVSAAHVYGKGRVAAEAFTSFKLTWDETFADFKRDADRHYARGVTHLVFHTYTHNPRVGLPGPGSAFGRGIGSPFMRGQCWWPKMPLLTDYFARCEELLESGKPVVDVLWYLGDDCAHKPSEKTAFPAGYKYDYVTYDALSSRASAKGGRIAFPDGMEYALLWVPDGAFLRPESARRIAAMEAAGARVVRGSPAALAAALENIPPDVVYDAPPGEQLDDFMWYHRRTDAEDVYFLATSCERGYRGTVRFRPGGASCRVELPPSGSVFVHVRDGKALVEDPSRAAAGAPLRPSSAVRTVRLDSCPMSEPYPLAPFRTYETNFVVTAEEMRRGLALDFGAMRGVLDVAVNGRRAASLWCPPFVCEATPFVKDGLNTVKVEWTGTWRRRLRLDATLPEASRRTWTEPPVH